MDKRSIGEHVAANEQGRYVLRRYHMQVISELVRKLDEAISKKDIESTLAIYSENSVVVKLPGQEARGIDQIRTHYEALYSMNIPMTVRTESLSMVQIDNLVLATSNWILEGVDPEGNTGSVRKVASMLFAKDGSDNWHLLIDNPFGPELG